MGKHFTTLNRRTLFQHHNAWGAHSPGKLYEVELALEVGKVKVFVEEAGAEHHCPQYRLACPGYDRCRRSSGCLSVQDDPGDRRPTDQVPRAWCRYNRCTAVRAVFWLYCIFIGAGERLVKRGLCRREITAAGAKLECNQPGHAAIIVNAHCVS